MNGDYHSLRLVRSRPSNFLVQAGQLFQWYLWIKLWLVAAKMCAHWSLKIVWTS